MYRNFGPDFDGDSLKSPKIHNQISNFFGFFGLCDGPFVPTCTFGAYVIDHGNPSQYFADDNLDLFLCFKVFRRDWYHEGIHG